MTKGIKSENKEQCSEFALTILNGNVFCSAVISSLDLRPELKLMRSTSRRLIKNKKSVLEANGGVAEG